MMMLTPSDFDDHVTCEHKLFDDKVFVSSAKLTSSSISSMRSRGYTRFISTAEVLAIPLAVFTYARHLTGRKFICFTDNEAARGCFIKGWSSKDISTDLVYASRCMLSSMHVGFWIERVLSHSNIADPPSRDVRYLPGGVHGTSTKFVRHDLIPSEIQLEDV